MGLKLSQKKMILTMKNKYGASKWSQFEKEKQPFGL
jgi:hypothetical protein